MIHNPEILFLGMNSRETLKNEQGETCMRMFLMALFIKAKKKLETI